MTAIIDRELIHCTKDGCVDTGCQVVLLSDGTVRIANISLPVAEAIADDPVLAGVIAEHPDKGLVKGELRAVHAALTALVERHPQHG